MSGDLLELLGQALEGLNERDRSHILGACVVRRGYSAAPRHYRRRPACHHLLSLGARGRACVCLCH
jgi:hypothetical protein